MDHTVRLFILKLEGHKLLVADCTKSHVGHIFLEPRVDYRMVDRANQSGTVISGSDFKLVVCEDLLHGCDTFAGPIYRHNDVMVAIQVEDWGAFIDRIPVLILQIWKPGDNGNKAAKFVLGVHGSVEGDGPPL